MNQDLRFYTLCAALSSSANFAATLFFEASHKTSSTVPLAGVYGLSQAVALKGMSLIPLHDEEGKLSLVAKHISRYLFASICIFFVSKALNAPLTFKAALITGLTFEYLGGGLLCVACITFAVGVVTLHKLRIIDGVSFRKALSEWTSDKEGNTLLGYLLMNKLLEKSIS